jgi:CRP-like cAMP-binding protein
VTDLRDQLPAFEAAARRLLERPPRRLVLVHARPATCHPDRPLQARSLCRPCYELAWQNGTLEQHPTKRTMRRRADFVADYAHLRSYGYTRRQIAERLGMTIYAVRRAYQRAVDAGALEPDRRTA